MRLLRSLSTAAVAAALAGCGGTSLAPLDARALLNQQRAAAAILSHLEGLEGGTVPLAGDAGSVNVGAVRSLAESVYCGAGGTLRRAGKAPLDGGVPCP